MVVVYALAFVLSVAGGLTGFLGLHIMWVGILGLALPWVIALLLQLWADENPYSMLSDI